MPSILHDRDRNPFLLSNKAMGNCTVHSHCCTMPSGCRQYSLPIGNMVLLVSSTWVSKDPPSLSQRMSLDLWKAEDKPSLSSLYK